MRQLRFVTLTEDGDQLLLQAADDEEQFALPLDATVRIAATQRLAPAHAATEVGPRPGRPETEDLGEVAISPREIQVRVRAGQSPEQLAQDCGMSLERVMRFAGPVLDERIRITDEARRARARSTGGGSGAEGRLVQFGEAVDSRFRAHGIDAGAVQWSARRRDDGEWLVGAQWHGGDGTHAAEWLFSRSARTVTPMDDTAADLLSDRPIRPVAPPERKRPNLSAAPPLVPGIVAFPPMPDADTGPVPMLEEVFDQEAAPEGPRLAPSASRPVSRPVSRPLSGQVANVSEGTGIDFDAPPLPLGISDPVSPAVPHVRNLGVTRREESDEDRAARARVPSWDDILLGVRRKED